MVNEFPIYFRDLTEDAKKRFLEFLNITEEESNFDIAPLTILYVEDDEDDEFGD